MAETNKRCPWCGDDPVYVAYHDEVWGRANYNRQDLFAKLCLDGQQAGLSWITILRKQESYYQAFANFVPERIAEFSEHDIERLMTNKGIVRNRLKIRSIIKNAHGYLALEQQGENFSQFLWSFVDGKPIINYPNNLTEIATETAESRAMSKALKKAGFSFVGPTICYAFMQAVGMVNDHLVNCPAKAASLTHA